MPEEQQASGQPSSASTARAAAPAERTVIDAVADLLQTVVDWLRQEAEALVREKVARPIQKAGLAVAAALAAGVLLAFGLCFIATGLLLLLAEWLTWPGALLAIGGVLVLGSAGFAVVKVRSLQ
ncbi:MAG TPA: phage holin family protein [Coriobacteriia bacterium]|nr:phage holin family protein [Coriobacteriia bacterium]